MGVKIQADEISSIIKERIDNFELNVDIAMSHSRPKLCIVGTDDYTYLSIQAAVAAATTEEWPIEIMCTTHQQMKKILNEHYLNEINNKHRFDHLMVLAEKENHPHGWYRKFEKKRF